LIAVPSSKQAGVFLGKLCWDSRKNHGCGQKKTVGTSTELVGTTAKHCELKRCADRARTRTANKDEIVERKFSNLNFFPSTKRQLSILLKFFFPFINI